MIPQLMEIKKLLKSILVFIRKFYIQYLENKNLGPNNNLSEAYRQCKGKYIALCEGDDYWTHPFNFEKQIDFMEYNPDYVICYHNANIINDNNEIVSTSKLPEELKKDFSQTELIKGVMILTLTMCFRNVLKKLPAEICKVKNGDKFLTSLLGNWGKGKYLENIENAVYRKHNSSIWSSLDEITQIFYNGDTRAWLCRYYQRINKSEISAYFKSEAENHFNNIIRKINNITKPDYIVILNKVLNDYVDILSNQTLDQYKGQFNKNKEEQSNYNSNKYRLARAVI